MTYVGSRYYVTFIHDYTRYTSVYFMKTKDEALEKFKEFHSFAVNFTGEQGKVLRTDSGGEYCSKAFDAYLNENGITHQLTVPAQNGVAKQMNRAVVESARSMLSHSNMPNEFWAEAVNTVIYETAVPLLIWIESHLMKACLTQNQLSQTLGYLDVFPLFRTFMFPTISEQCSMQSRDVVFFEGKFHDFGEEHSIQKRTYPIEDDVKVNVQDVPVENERVSHCEPEQPVPEPENRNQRVGATYEENFIREVQNLDAKRQRRPPTRFDEEVYAAADNLTADINEPVSIQEAWTGEHSVDWKRAANSEYESLMNNQTWELVPPPDNKNIVGSRWVFKVKHAADGTAERFKARLVAQGYSQSQGVDYHEIFSPMVRYSSIRSLLAVANICN